MVRLRQLVHGVNEEIEESWRSQAPQFDHNGVPVLGFSATKTSVNVTFCQGAQLRSSRLQFEPAVAERASRCLKFHEEDAVNEQAFSNLVKKALAQCGRAHESAMEGKGHMHHAELEAVLHKDPSAWANRNAFGEACTKEYAEWVADGKKEETRKRRIAQALEMIREGVHKDEVLHRVKGE
jgi:hypothetical protein